MIGTAVAAPPPPPPPGIIGGGPAAPQGPAGPSGPSVAIDIPPQNENRFVPNEVVLEFPGNFTPDMILAVARRHRLARLEVGRHAEHRHDLLPCADRRRPLGARRAGGAAQRDDAARRPAELHLHRRAAVAGRAVERAAGRAAEPAGAANPGSANPGPAGPTSRRRAGRHLHAARPQTPVATPAAAAAAALPALGGDPAQYALTKLRLQEAHSLTKGNNILVAVIDSGIDAGHPELRGVIAGTYDALGKAEKPHTHGTAMAGTIAARSRLMGVAPAARILAIRAFGAISVSAQATTFAIIKGLEHAMAQNARIVNMSFAGPMDPGLGRSLAAARSRGIVLVAASGNLGEKAPPQYPAADPNVIAVSATDANDKLFRGSVRGRHIAVAAPGVDILVPAPNANYDVTTGTSVAAAHVSGVIALILERKPDLDPDSVRKILLATARDLGAVGPDPEFGAGLADAYQALISLEQRKVAGPDMPAAQPVSTAQ